MDPFHYDAYTSYSDASTPRTPSPRSDDFHPLSQSPATYKTELDPPVRNIFSDPMHDEHGVTPEGHRPWQGLQSPQYNYNGSRGSLLSELYDHDVGPEHHIPQDVYVDHDAYHQRSEPIHAPEIAMMRRATYPYVRQDRDDVPYPAPVFIPQHDEPLMGPYTSRTDTLYGEPLPMMDNSPQYISLGPAPSMHSSMSSSPASSYHEFDKLDPNVKLEESAPVIVPSQTCLYRPSSSGAVPPMSYLSPHTGLPVQHTDDAASKETQYLRRRCFNCSQTEPPSWRRSTLNPGKIVCNKCGLYERTHLRPRPLRFDELRTGNKSRKQSKAGAGSPASKARALVKKEESETMSRRASVSSTSSAQSSSDWDDSLSMYSSSGSAPPSSFNSPAATSFSLPLDQRSSHSPPLLPRDGGIRLPNTPLSDIASLAPRKAATAPEYGMGDAMQGDFFGRRASLPGQMPEVTGWQTVPMGELKRGKHSPVPKAVAA